ncbi:MAG: hypothetical protein AAGE52_42980 [Myxococcota bacterium]
MRALLLTVSLTGCSLLPSPPTTPGQQWSEFHVHQTTRGFATPHTRLSVERSVIYVGTYSVDRPYQFTATIRGFAQPALMHCSMVEGGYRCDVEGALLFHLNSACTEGHAMIDGKPWRIEAWYSEGTHVGYLLSRHARFLAAVDTDHTWRRRNLVDPSLTQNARVEVELAAAALHDLLEVNEGRPFLCHPVMHRRRAFR